MLDLLLFLLLGHFLGDFALQTDRMAQQKPTCVKTLTVHVVIYTFTVAVFLFFGLYTSGSQMFLSATTAVVLVLLFIEHWIQDYIKGHKFNGGNQAFYFDQGLHILVLYAVRLFVYNG